MNQSDAERVAEQLQLIRQMWARWYGFSEQEAECLSKPTSISDELAQCEGHVLQQDMEIKMLRAGIAAKDATIAELRKLLNSGE